MSKPKVPLIGLITCVRMDTKGTVTHLGIVPILGDGDVVIFEKAEVVAALKQPPRQRPDLIPVWHDGTRKRLGPLVHEVAGKYVTTNPNDETRDNLGNMNECAS